MYLTVTIFYFSDNMVSQTTQQEKKKKEKKETLYRFAFLV